MVLLSLFLINSVVFSQKKTSNFLRPYKVALLFNKANEKNFIFDDTDYLYKTLTFKYQSFHKIASAKKINFELIIQPQIQFLEHKLLNLWFVKPTETDFEKKREEFLQLKRMLLFGVEFGFSANIKLLKNIYANTTIGLGFMYINTRTERLAKGFTFVENGSIGFTVITSKNNALYFGGNFGHVSNLNFQSPNSGYNVLGFEIGIQFFL